MAIDGIMLGGVARGFDRARRTNLAAEEIRGNQDIRRQQLKQEKDASLLNQVRAQLTSNRAMIEKSNERIAGVLKTWQPGPARDEAVNKLLSSREVLLRYDALFSENVGMPSTALDNESLLATIQTQEQVAEAKTAEEQRAGISAARQKVAEGEALVAAGLQQKPTNREIEEVTVMGPQGQLERALKVTTKEDGVETSVLTDQTGNQLPRTWIETGKGVEMTGQFNPGKKEMFQLVGDSANAAGRLGQMKLLKQDIEEAGAGAFGRRGQLGRFASGVAGETIGFFAGEEAGSQAAKEVAESITGTDPETLQRIRQRVLLVSNARIGVMVGEPNSARYTDTEREIAIEAQAVARNETVSLPALSQAIASLTVLDMLDMNRAALMTRQALPFNVLDKEGINRVGAELEKAGFSAEPGAVNPRSGKNAPSEVERMLREMVAIQKEMVKLPFFQKQ